MLAYSKIPEHLIVSFTRTSARCHHCISYSTKSAMCNTRFTKYNLQNKETVYIISEYLIGYMIRDQFHEVLHSLSCTFTCDSPLCLEQQHALKNYINNNFRIFAIRLLLFNKINLNNTKKGNHMCSYDQINCFL